MSHATLRNCDCDETATGTPDHLYAMEIIALLFILAGHPSLLVHNTFWKTLRKKSKHASQSYGMLTPQILSEDQNASVFHHPGRWFQSNRLYSKGPGLVTSGVRYIPSRTVE